MYYALNTDTVTLWFSIEHDWGHSGTMRVILWGVANYGGSSSWTGKVMGMCRLETIENGYCYNDCEVKVSRTSPTDGEYTIIMELQAYYHDEYEQCDYRVFDDKVIIPREIKLGGASYSYEIFSLSLTVKELSHNFSGGAGSFKLVLWACDNRVENGHWCGYKIGKAQIGPLAKDEYYPEVTKHTNLLWPPGGWYFVVMQVKSREDGKWVSRAHIEFSNKFHSISIF